MIELNNINKSYDNNIVLKDISLSIKQGETIALMGKSGSGKSTILNIIGLLENYDNGSYILDNIEVNKLQSKDHETIFKNKISYLFQNYALIDDESVLFNLDLVFVDKMTKQLKHQKIIEALKLVGLEDNINDKVYKLSGGQQQRIAIARLFLKDCKIILADEPTGSLDEENRDIVLNLLQQLKKQNKTIVIATHDLYVARWCDKIYKL